MIWDLGLAFEFFHVFLGVAKSSLKAHHLRLQIDNSAQTKRTSSKVCNILQGCMAHRFPIWYTMPNYQLWAPQAWSNPVVDVVNEGEFRATPGGGEVLDCRVKWRLLGILQWGQLLRLRKWGNYRRQGITTETVSRESDAWPSRRKEGSCWVGLGELRPATSQPCDWNSVAYRWKSLKPKRG